MIRSSPAALFAGLALVFVGACSRAPQAGAAGPVAAAVGQAPSFLQRMPEAPMTVAYRGERRVRLDYLVAGVPSVLEYDEDVSSDGLGHFSIVPGALISPAMSPAQAEVFALLQERRDGFFYRFRDFRIRDWRSFLRNWSATDLGVQEVVAGRTCSVLEFRKIREGSSWYRAWIDLETSLTMRAEEFDASGNRLALVQFTTFTLSPDLANAPLHGDRTEPVPIDTESDTTASLGFQVLRPKILPEGYRLQAAESVTDGSARWARLVFGDGVEEIFFLQSRSDAEAQAAVPPTEVDVGPKYVRVFRVGPWTVIQGQFHRMRAIVMGKADEESLLRTLKSAIH